MDQNIVNHRTSIIEHPARDKTIPKHAIPLGYEGGKTYFLGLGTNFKQMAWYEDVQRWCVSFGRKRINTEKMKFVCAPKQLIYVVHKETSDVPPADVMFHYPHCAVVKVKVKDQDYYVIGRTTMSGGDYECIYQPCGESSSLEIQDNEFWGNSTRQEMGENKTTNFYYVCVWPNDHSGAKVDIGHGNELADLGPDGMTDVSNMNDESNQTMWRNAVFCIAEAKYDCFPAIDSPMSIGMKHGSKEDEQCMLQYTGDVFIKRVGGVAFTFSSKESKGVAFANLKVQNGQRTVAWVIVQIGHTFEPGRSGARVGEQLRRALTDSLCKGHKMMLHHLKSLPAKCHHTQSPALEPTALPAPTIGPQPAATTHFTASPQTTTSQSTVPPAYTQTVRSTPSQAVLSASYDDNRGVILNPENCEIELRKVFEGADRLEVAFQQKSRLNADGDVKTTGGKLKTAVDTRCSISSYDPEIVYENFSYPKGLAIVFNNENFSNMDPRTGTNIDAGNICKLLTQIGYEVTLKPDHSALDMLAAMTRFAQKAGHKDYDSAVVVVLSHGGFGKIYGIDCMDEADGISLKQFIGCLNANKCAGLRGKPKLFFIQACRGLFTDDGQHTNTVDRQGTAAANIGALSNFPQITDAFSFMEQEDIDFADGGSKLPLNSDIFTAFSTTSGYVSWRNNKEGSWFIQALVQVFQNKCATEDLLSMMTEVNKIVADAYETSSGEKQLPEFRSQLRKKFYFFPGLTSPPKP